MNCDRLHLLLDDFLAGRLDDLRSRAIHAHLSACAECADVVRWIRGDGPGSVTGLWEGVVAQTSGRACSRVRERLPAFVEAGEPPESVAAIENHLDHCASCQRESGFQRRLGRELSVWREVDPGPDFVADVLMVTLPRPSAWHVFSGRLRERVRRWGARPALAQELAFALTLALVLVTRGPAAPWPALPERALELLRGEAVAAPVHALWPASFGDEVDPEIRIGAAERSEREEAAAGRHLHGVGRALGQGDLAVASREAARLGQSLLRGLGIEFGSRKSSPRAGPVPVDDTELIEGGGDDG